MKTPINDMLNKYAEQNAVRLHMPGHKGMLKGFERDITELSFSDNLRNPTDVIAQSQQLYADELGARCCMYSVNGSTGGLFALAANCRGKVLVESNCHVSLLNGLKLFSKEYTVVENTIHDGIPMPLTLSQIEGTLSENSDIGTVFLTSPNYFGINADMKEIYMFLRRKQVLLFVDSAHGAHFGLHPLLPSNAVNFCDAVVESCHKTLPAMTQTAVVMTNDIDLGKDIKKSLNMVTTTSPSFVLVASIESAMDYTVTHREQYTELKKCVDGFVEDVTSHGWKVVSNDDFTRLVIDCSGHGKGTDVADFLERNNVFVEHYTDRYIVCILTLMDGAIQLDRLLEVLTAYNGSRSDRLDNYVDMCFEKN